jgi:UDP-glucose 4-epimerase
VRILLTGAAGFVGRRVLRALLNASHEVIALTHCKTELGLLEGGRVTALQGDLCTRDLYDRLPGLVDAVISLAQSVHYLDFPARSEDIFAVNVEAAFRLADWGRRNGTERFVLVSSGGVRALESHVWGRASAAPATPIDFYLNSKFCAEAILRAYRNLFRTLVICRPFFVYGPGQSPHMLIPRLIQSVRLGKPLQLRGPDGLRLSPVYVDDVASALARSVELAGFAEFDIGGPQDLTLREIGEAIARRLGKQALFTQAPGKPENFVAARSEVYAGLGIKPTPFEEGLNRLIGVHGIEH